MLNYIRPNLTQNKPEVLPLSTRTTALRLGSGSLSHTELDWLMRSFLLYLWPLAWSIDLFVIQINMFVNVISHNFVGNII